jgi:hypothetical protein
VVEGEVLTRVVVVRDGVPEYGLEEGERAFGAAESSVVYATPSASVCRLVGPGIYVLSGSGFYDPPRRRRRVAGTVGSRQEEGCGDPCEGSTDER